MRDDDSSEQNNMKFYFAWNRDWMGKKTKKVRRLIISK